MGGGESSAPHGKQNVERACQRPASAGVDPRPADVIVGTSRARFVAHARTSSSIPAQPRPAHQAAPRPGDRRARRTRHSPSSADTKPGTADARRRSARIALAVAPSPSSAHRRDQHAVYCARIAGPRLLITRFDVRPATEGLDPAGEATLANPRCVQLRVGPGVSLRSPSTGGRYMEGCIGFRNTPTSRRRRRRGCPSRTAGAPVPSWPLHRETRRGGRGNGATDRDQAPDHAALEAFGADLGDCGGLAHRPARPESGKRAATAEAGAARLVNQDR